MMFDGLFKNYIRVEFGLKNNLMDSKNNLMDSNNSILKSLYFSY